MPATFTFYHEVERDNEQIDLEVTYSVYQTFWRGDVDVEIDSIEPDIKLTEAEESAIYAVALDRADEDAADAAADYADYRYDMARDAEWAA
jgi:hypothetical protein